MISPLVAFNLKWCNSHNEQPGFIASYKWNRHPIASHRIPLSLSEAQLNESNASHHDT